MKCPFCNEEMEPVEKVSGSRADIHCAKCRCIVASYQKSMEEILKNLVSLERFERRTK